MRSGGGGGEARRPSVTPPHQRPRPRSPLGAQVERAPASARRCRRGHPRGCHSPLQGCVSLRRRSLPSRWTTPPAPVQETTAGSLMDPVGRHPEPAHHACAQTVTVPLPPPSARSRACGEVSAGVHSLSDPFECGAAGATDHPPHHHGGGGGGGGGGVDDGGNGGGVHGNGDGGHEVWWH
ncbi:hypothetical protein BU14_0200s0010 [Porphyra umbilicalis]|uniref:Uncharacterized protein n=1 Tax=Porphyra umbilicalis TaxID=2786 RepID=A0A1X6P688_PORUM|nr:hypothetical protein BU14_0200s0010 [Porphyra umbilicalis]|eukprot:OSX76255.1 hypothetical protein BU14_0200s0010 [Porphyra umbilicalis]